MKSVKLWDIKAAAETIEQDSLSDLDLKKYLLVIIIFGEIGMWLGGYAMIIPALAIFWFIAAIAVKVLGLNYCFKSNLNRDGKDFIKRFLVLSVPIAIRLSVASLVVGTLLAIPICAILKPSFSGLPVQMSYFLLDLCLELIFFIWVARWLKRLNLRPVS